MIIKNLAVSIVFFFLFSLTASRAAAQPTLPDIAGSANNGIVILTWNCQYNGIKTIAVYRSADSGFNYSIIGYVKKLDKGIQAFVDGHPAAGRNFYKLSIVFNSGLSWSSNHFGITIERSILESSHPLLPANDSLQKYIVTDSKPRSEAQKESDRTEQVKKAQTSKDANDALSTVAQNSKQAPANCKVSLSFDEDTAQRNRVQLKHKVTISFDDPDTEQPMLIPSKLVFTDPLSGHVHMNLPDDVKQHRYSVRFYDLKKNMVMEVPLINSSKVIFDKRNFQHKGVYKFILRKDVTELESGYINIY